MEFLTKLCYLLEEHYGGESRWAEGRCGEELWQHCGHPISESLLEAVRLGKDKTNLTECLASTYGLTPAVVAAAAPPKVRPRPYFARESLCAVCVHTHARCCHSNEGLILCLLLSIEKN